MMTSPHFSQGGEKIAQLFVLHPSLRKRHIHVPLLTRNFTQSDKSVTPMSVAELQCPLPGHCPTGRPTDVQIRSRRICARLKTARRVRHMDVLNEIRSVFRSFAKCLVKTNSCAIISSPGERSSTWMCCFRS